MEMHPLTKTFYFSSVSYILFVGSCIVRITRSTIFIQRVAAITPYTVTISHNHLEVMPKAECR